MNRVSGTKIFDKLAYSREVFGEKITEQVVESLSSEDQAEINVLLAIGWYSIDLYDRLVNQIIQIGAGGDLQVLDRMGEHSADALSSSSHRAFYRTRDPETLLTKMAPVHATLNDPGHMEVELLGSGHLRIEVRQPPSPSERHCRIAKAFYRRSVELCDVQEVSVDETRCSARGDATCRFEVHWQD